MMKFTIFTLEEGRFLLNVQYSTKKIKCYGFTEHERMKMLALIDKILGEEPEEALATEAEQKNEN